MRERLQNLLEQGEKITPKQWKAEIQSLQAEYDSIGKEKSKTATELAYANYPTDAGCAKVYWFEDVRKLSRGIFVIFLIFIFPLFS